MKNYKKAEMYSKSITKYKKAFKEEFYFECILLVYSLLEDRLNDFLIKIMFAYKNNGYIRFRKYKKKYLIENLGVEKNKCSLKNFSNKIVILKRIVNIYEITNYVVDIDIQAVINVLKRNKISNELNDPFFEELDQWRNKRNDIVHGLLNKDIKIFDSLRSISECGYKLFRIMDNCVKKINEKTKKEIGKLKKQENLKNK